MRAVRRLDALIGQALECADEAAGEVRDLPLEPVETNIRRIANVVLELWKVRDELYAKEPSVKRDFVKERETNKARYEALSELMEEAAAAEGEGRVEEASALFKQLLVESTFGFFKLCAEAGLYRTSRMTKV